MNRYLTHRNPVLRLVGTATAVAGAAVLAAAGLAGATLAPATTALPGSAAPWVAQTAVTGAVPASAQLDFQVWLKPNTSAATAFANAVSTPGASNYRHFLTPAQYTAQFGPSAAQADAVVNWLKGQGFTDVTVDAQRQRVSAAGPAAAVNSAFRTTMNFYQAHGTVNAGKDRLRTNATALQVPSSLSADVLGVTGLDNTAPILPFIKQTSVPGGHPLTAKAASTPVTTDVCSQYYGQNTITLPAFNGTTSFPTEGCGYSATQLRSAYGANSTNTGKGVTVAFVEGGVVPNMFQTLRQYAQAEGLPAPQSTKYTEFSLGQGPACGTWDGEEQMDVESAYDMAPDINILVAGGDSCSTVDAGLGGQLFDPESTVLGGNGNAPLATVVSNSWESDAESQPSSWTDIEHAFLLRAAAEGVTMLFSSGDGPGVLMPSSDPYATAVGGTTLGIGQDNGKLFATGWSTAEYGNESGSTWTLFGLQGGAGGGASTIWAQPGYQQHVVPKSMATPVGNRGGLVRTVPDISGVADPFTGMSVGTLDGTGGTYEAFDIAGTSLAAPLNAGIIAAAEQGQHTPFGFINPLLYKLSKGNAFQDVLPQTASTPALDRYNVCETACGAPFWLLVNFNVQDPNVTFSNQVTAAGYDTTTGLGEPNGQNYINALRSGH
jgi:subtilase family serine protease